jgi:hypothetical protein
MKVKIGNKIYDSNKEPIMVILGEDDRENITNMEPTATKYCSFPDSEDTTVVQKWMSNTVQEVEITINKTIKRHVKNK